MALLSSESGVMAAGFLISYALFIDTAKDKKQALVKLMPAATVFFGWLITYKFLGYGVSGSGELFTDPVNHTSLYIVKFLQNVPHVFLLWLAIFRKRWRA